MSCLQYQDRFIALLLSELPAEEMLSVESHLKSGCPPCQAEYQATREALDLAFESIPAVPISQEQQRKIARQALRSQPPTVPFRPREVDLATRSDAPLRDVLQPVRLLQALLALAAGFFVMLGGQAWWRGAPVAPTTQAHQAAGMNDDRDGQPQMLSAAQPETIPGAQNAVRFVSLTVKPTQPVAGYFLADNFSHELHIIGNINRPPLPSEKFWLSLSTPTTETQIAVSVDQRGGFKALVPLPSQPIREVSLLGQVAN